VPSWRSGHAVACRATLLPFKSGTWLGGFCGHSREVPPGPIPNPAVKLSYVDYCTQIREFSGTSQRCTPLFYFVVFLFFLVVSSSSIVILSDRHLLSYSLSSYFDPFRTRQLFVSFRWRTEHAKGVRPSSLTSTTVLRYASSRELVNAAPPFFLLQHSYSS
jgi:hypothetical protein